MKPYNTTVTLVEGVPGSGKTYEITHKANNEDLILTVARCTKDETAERVTKLHKGTTVSTFDSYLINSGKKYKTVYLDEGLMLQPGEIDIVAMISNAENVYVNATKSN